MQASSDMISSGAKKDLMVLNFCAALMQVSRLNESKKDESVVSRTNRDYRINKKIDAALDILFDDIKSVIDEILSKDAKTALWLKKNLDKRIKKMMIEMQAETVNLEMFAIWVLYVNFAEKQRTLHPLFTKFCDTARYFSILDMMEKTAISEINGDMFILAYETIKQIKA
jgi:hypothetical protein